MTPADEGLCNPCCCAQALPVVQGIPVQPGPGVIGIRLEPPVTRLDGSDRVGGCHEHEGPFATVFWGDMIHSVSTSVLDGAKIRLHQKGGHIR